MPSHHQNSRRRFLAFLGLVGAPAAVWAPARAQTSPAPPSSLNCQAAVENSLARVEYFRNFQLVDGVLVNDDSDGTIQVIEAALSHEFAAGYDADSLPVPNGETFNGNSPRFTVNGIDYPTLMRCSFMCTLKVPKIPTAITLVQIFSDTKAIGTTASFTPMASDPSRVVVSGAWNMPPIETLNTTFYVRIMADEVGVAQFGFNFSDLNWQDLQKKANQEFAGRKGVTVDAQTGASNVPNCAVASGACFLTTAASLTLGLSDDCWELQTLRRFRDGPLSDDASGRALVARYYAEAPRLVAAINDRRDAARVWLGAYWAYILPCAVLACTGLKSWAIAHYTRLFKRLNRLAA